MARKQLIMNVGCMHGRCDRGSSTWNGYNMYFGYNGLIGLLVLVGDVWAILNIIQSSVSNEKKLIWIVAVALLPVLGLILWYFLGPRTGRS